MPAVVFRKLSGRCQYLLTSNWYLSDAETGQSLARASAPLWSEQSNMAQEITATIDRGRRHTAAHVE